MTARYALATNIQLDEQPFMAIGDDEHLFTGRLEGLGHSLFGLSPGYRGLYRNGLFTGMAGNGAVSHLVLVEPIVSGGNWVGAVAGRIGENARIRSVNVVAGMITADSARAFGMQSVR